MNDAVFQRLQNTNSSLAGALVTAPHLGAYQSKTAATLQSLLSKYLFSKLERSVIIPARGVSWAASQDLGRFVCCD